MTGVCLETVKAVKHRIGKVNQIGAAVQRPGTGQRCKAPQIIPPDMEAEPSWCGKCKAMVYQPCLKCQLRAIKMADGAHGWREEPTDLELDNNVEGDGGKTMQERYEEMRPTKGQTAEQHRREVQAILEEAREKLP